MYFNKYLMNNQQQWKKKEWQERKGEITNQHLQQHILSVLPVSIFKPVFPFFALWSHFSTLTLEEWRDYLQCYDKRVLGLSSPSTHTHWPSTLVDVRHGSRESRHHTAKVSPWISLSDCLLQGNMHSLYILSQVHECRSGVRLQQIVNSSVELLWVFLFETERTLLMISSGNKRCSKCDTESYSNL